MLFACLIEEIAAAYPGRLTIIQGDALEVDPLAHLNPPIRIAANLPYNIGTELLVGWLTPPEWPPFWTSLTLMFQKEVAERVLKSGEKEALDPMTPFERKIVHDAVAGIVGVHSESEGVEPSRRVVVLVD